MSDHPRPVAMYQHKEKNIYSIYKNNKNKNIKRINYIENRREDGNREEGIDPYISIHTDSLDDLTSSIPKTHIQRSSTQNHQSRGKINE